MDTQRQSSSLQTTLREPFQALKLIEITFHTNLPKIRQHDNYIYNIPKIYNKKFVKGQTLPNLRTSEYQYIAENINHTLQIQLQSSHSLALRHSYAIIKFHHSFISQHSHQQTIVIGHAYSQSQNLNMTFTLYLNNHINDIYNILRHNTNHQRTIVINFSIDHTIQKYYIQHQLTNQIINTSWSSWVQ